MVEMQYVDSSNIEAIGHDVAAQELHVRFLSGDLYVYHGVPQEVYDDLMASSSKGSYLNRVIKERYEYTKM
ncbi:MAG: KTSC domain-containing protein [Sedimentisphaerales bacterium]